MTCPYCGSDELLDLMVMERREPIAHMCHGCGRRIPHVVYRPHRYVPPLQYAVFTARIVARVLPRDVEVGPPIETRSIHCGPPADQPRPPTPGQILAAAGLIDPWDNE